MGAVAVAVENGDGFGAHSGAVSRGYAVAAIWSRNFARVDSDEEG